MTDAHTLTRFAPGTPPPGLDDRAHAAVHAKQIVPSGTHELTLPDLFAAVQRAATLGRKGDAGYLVAGRVEGTRSNTATGPASLAIVDADDAAPPWDLLAEFEGFGHTTASHGLPGPDGAPRSCWRFYIPFVEPVAHGQLPAPWPGAHIRARSQPAFLPTHVSDLSKIEFRWLGGTKRLDGGAAAPVLAPASESLLAALFEAAGWALREQSTGLAVICPWVHEHTGRDQGGTVVLHADPDGQGLGKFHCSHGHCAGRGSRDALAVLKQLPSVQAELRHWPEPMGLGAVWTRVDEPTDPKGGALSAEPGAPAVLVPALDGPAAPQPDPRLTASAEAWVAHLNSRYTVLTAVGGSGKVRVFSWGPSQLDASWRVPVLQSPNDFKLRHAPLHARIEGMLDEQGRPASVAVAPWWFGRTDRAEATSITFRPDRPERMVDGQLNLWRGWGVERRQGGTWKRMQQLIDEVMAGGDAEASRYIYGWLAWVLQNPGARAEVVLVFRGGKGTGKNTLLDAVCKLFGQHGKSVSSPKHLTGNFNGHLQDCAFLFANESIPPNDKAAESILKALVTDPTLSIERKGIDVEHVPNCLSIAMASNEAWCVPAGIDERRFAVFNVTDVRKGDHAFFRELHAEMRAGGYEAMLADLLAFQLGDWHPRQDIPKTVGLLQQQLRSLRGVDRVMYDALLMGENPGQPDGEVHGGNPPWVGATFVSTVQMLEDLPPGMSAQLVADALKDCGGEAAQVYVKNFGTNVRVRGWWLPPLDVARAAWAAAKRLEGLTWPHHDGWR